MRRENEKKCATRPSTRSCEVPRCCELSASVRCPRYGLSKAHVDAVVLPAPVKTAHATATLERQVQAGGHRAKSKAAKAAARPAVVAVMAAQADLLSHGQRLSLLRALYQRLHKLLGLRGGAAAPADAPAGDKQVRPRHLLCGVCDAATLTAVACPLDLQAPAAAAAPGRKRGRAAPAGDGDAEARAYVPSWAVHELALCVLPSHAALASNGRTRPRGKAAADAGKAAAGPVASLVAMGFDAKMSADALEETGGDVERAVAWLFANTQS
jgi:hypothetical protein